jgi:hypothetical protein
MLKNRNWAAVLAVAAVVFGLFVAASSAGAKTPLARPTISVLPVASGTTEGGTTVTLRGANFVHVSAVLFGTTAGTRVSVAGPTKLTVRSPQHVPGRVNVRVVVSYKGSTSESAHSAADLFTYHAPADQRTWSGPTQPFGPPSRGPGAVSCPTSTFCEAVSLYGTVFTYDGSAWKRTSQLGAVQGIPRPHVVCQTSTWCEASIGTSDIYHYDGASWAAIPVTTGHSDDGITALACAARSFCAAGTDTGYAYIFNGTTWSGGTQIDQGFDREDPVSISSISCPSSAFCAAGDTYDNVTTYNGTTWSAPTNIVRPDFGPMTVACPSSTYCLAVTASAGLIRFDGTSWTAFDDVPSSLVPRGVVCPTATYCLVLGNDNSSVYDGTYFGPVQPAGADLNYAGTCAAVNFCVALSTDGAVVHTRAGWSKDNAFDPPGGGLANISCAAGPVCVAIDLQGKVKTYRSGSWSSDAAIVPRVLNQLSCVSATFCVAATNSGPQMFNGSKWTVATSPDTSLFHVSCASTTYCVAMGYSGDTYSYNGTKWTARATTSGAELSVTGVSCTAASHCLAIVDADENGTYGWYSEVFDGKTWGAPTMVSSDDVNGLSCVSASFCVAAGGADAFTYNGTRWTAQPLGLYSTAVSCGSTTFCVAVSSSGNQATVFTGTSWTKPASVGPAATRLEDVSCTSDGFCLVNDNDANAYIRS